MWDVKASKSDISLGKCQWEAIVQSAAWEVLVNKGMYTGHVWLGWWMNNQWINNSITLHTKMILLILGNFYIFLPWFELELLSHTLKWFRWIYPSHTLDLATVVLHDIIADTYRTTDTHALFVTTYTKASNWCTPYIHVAHHCMTNLMTSGWYKVITKWLLYSITRRSLLYLSSCHQYRYCRYCRYWLLSSGPAPSARVVGAF